VTLPLFFSWAIPASLSDQDVRQQGSTRGNRSAAIALAAKPLCIGSGATDYGASTLDVVAYCNQPSLWTARNQYIFRVGVEKSAVVSRKRRYKGGLGLSIRVLANEARP